MIKTLLVGYGYWGKKIFSTLQMDGRYSIHSIVDLKPIEIENSSMKTESNLDKVLLNQKFDLAIIATNPASHFEITKKLLQQGIHCVVEKPMALKLDEVKELFIISKKMKTILFTDYTYLFTEEFKCIYSEIHKIGNVFSFDSTRTNLGIIQSDTNVFWDLAVHDLAIIYTLFPDLVLRKVVAFGQIIEPSKVISDGVILLKFSNNFQAKIRVSWHTSVKSRDIKIFGKAGSILWNDLDNSRGLEIFYSRIELDVDRLNVDYMQDDGIIKKIPQISALKNEFDFIFENLRCDLTKLYEINYILNMKITSTLLAIEESLRSGEVAIDFEQ